MLIHKNTLITRAYEDSILLAKELRALNIHPIIDPLLEVNYLNGPELPLTGVQALLMTSANGVRAFAKRSNNQSILVCAVGDATAREAENQGFISVMSASGNVESLIKLVSESLQPEDGLLYHATGTLIAGDLKRELGLLGFNYRREVLYSINEAKAFSKSIVESFYSRKIGSVLLYSPRTAVIFRNLINAEGFCNKLDQVTVFCLSEAVANNVSMFSWKNVVVAEQPSQISLLRKVQQEIQK